MERLNQAEQIVLLAFVAAATTFDVVSMIGSPTGATVSRILSLFTTLTLALFVWSPLVATLALGIVVALSFVLGVPDGVLIGASIAALLVTRLGSAPLRLSYIAGVLLSTVGLVYSDRVSTGDIAVFLILATTCGAAGIAFRLALARSKRLEDRLAKQAEHEREAIRAERRWIADELHDSIAHHLTIISLHSQLLDEEEVRHTSQKAIEEASRKALSDIRFIINISDDSPSAEVMPTGDLAEAIGEAKGELEAAGHPVLIGGDPRDKTIPRGVEIILARMVRESATNIVKYADPGEVHFSLEVEPEFISLEIRSPLSSSQPRVNSSSGTGISRMSERALSLRGEFKAGPDGNEWVVFTKLPVGPQEET